jgi:hypothetical protein
MDALGIRLVPLQLNRLRIRTTCNSISRTGLRTYAHQIHQLQELKLMLMPGLTEKRGDALCNLSVWMALMNVYPL